MSTTPVLSVAISASYPGRPNVLRDLSLDVQPGEILGLVGQSGCGKSTLALAIPRLLHLKNGKVEGSIRFGGRDLMGLREREMRSLRGKSIALVLQSPISSLNPVLRIGTQLEEAWTAHRNGSSDERQQSIRSALESASLASSSGVLQQYPSQLSVGQAQRVLIAMAILHRPALLIADEPTSALDPSSRSEILQLFATLNRSLGMAILYISHEIESVSAMSDRVAVLSDGHIIESATADRLISGARHLFPKAAQRDYPSCAS